MATQRDEHTRVVLEGVPRIGFDTQKSFQFPASLEACMKFMGEDAGYDYTFIMGVSGAAFGLLWQRWLYTGDLTDYSANEAWPEPIKRAFNAIGYAYEFIVRKGNPEDEAYFRRRIIESISKRRRPVMANGVVGPPCCSIISGYDGNGDVLIGWSYFQSQPGHGPSGDFEPSGYFRKRNWYDDTHRLILIGEKEGKPPLDEIYRSSLSWALDLVRKPIVPRRHNGLRAYTAWAYDLLRDEYFPQDNLEALFNRLDCHFAAMVVASEGRWHAGQFLRRIVAHVPAMSEALGQAAACYDAESKMIAKIAELQGGWNPHDEKIARKLVEPTLRRQISNLIIQARDKDKEAAIQIERALA